ncbi:DNA polymerase-4 [Litorivivens lipolytica]|uniref:DNA polymerase IV n=1 Tax=Litorivivens lipolytica TaxID=1524264 RepID=A0A7W4Z780_9GAMM|nr:DNA polymerase-4 [Litorivivens lipolytica]
MRKIIHCDCDCFYASVEMRDDPALRGIPLAVGGASDRRGVIATCNYEARAYGVRSAMPSAHALRLCPSLVVIPPSFDKYRAAAYKVREIFHRYTDLVEPLSLDEAYLDVSDSPHFQGSATLIARAIRQSVSDEVGITISAGVAPNKFLAKVASDWDKPDGLTTITPDQVQDFVAALPVRRIHGVGPAMQKKLLGHNIERCGDILGWSKLELAQAFGSMGETLYRYARGDDKRPVANNRERKSLSVERTYAEDLPTRKACQSQLPNLLSKLEERLANLTRRGAITGHFVKLKSKDFETTTVDRQLLGGLDTHEFVEMMDEAWARYQKPVRLLGVGLRFHTDHMSSDQQLRLFD